jgi:heterodisulfide reductase subunit C
MALATKDMIAKFTSEVASAHGAGRALACYQCGKCTAGCPVARVTDAFSPKKIIRLVQLGLEKPVLDKKSPVWLCATCYNCLEGCPQDIEPTSIFLALKAMAARRGIVPMGRKMAFASLAKNGRMFEIKEEAGQARAELGLAACPEVDTARTVALLEMRGVMQILTGRKLG